MLAIGCGPPEVAGPDWMEPVTPTPAPARAPPRLHVDGTTLRTPAGAEVRLRGVNVCSLEFDQAGANWQPQPDGGSTTLDVLAARDRWRVNAVRMPINQEWLLTDDAYLSRVESLIDAAALRGVYVILDVQWEHGERTEPYQLNILKRPTFGFGNTTEALWHLAAGRWSNRDNLLFDVINEPHDVTPSELSIDMQRMVDRLAQRAPQTLVVVGGPDWAHSVDWWRLHPLKSANVVYSAHEYLPYDPPSSFDEHFVRPAQTLPVLVAEFGPDQDQLIDTAETAGVDGWMPWAIGCGLSLDADLDGGVEQTLAARLRDLSP